MMAATMDNRICAASSSSVLAWVESELKRERERMLRYARRKLRNIEDAEDAVQLASLRIYGAAPQFDRSRAFGPWAFRVLTNVIIDMIRQKTKLPIYHISDNFSEDGDSLELEIPDTRPGPLAALLADELSEPITIALASMTTTHREALLLCDLAECTYEQIAELTNSPIGTTRSRIHRARQTMRERLKGELLHA